VDYPREIHLSAEREQALISYLNDELIAHEAERSAWVIDLKSWQEDYWATPSQKEATFPFKGAANYVIPLHAIAAEAIHSKRATTLFALDQLVVSDIVDPQYGDLSYSLEKAIDRELYLGVDFRKFVDNTSLENIKLGTCVGKAGWEKIVKTAVKEEGDEEVEFDIVTRQGPTLDAVPLARFLMPFTALDPQSAPWCGEDHTANPYRIRQFCESGFFRPEIFDELAKFFTYDPQQSSSNYTQTVRTLQNQMPVNWPREVGWQEIWLSFDVDGSKKEKEIVVHYHRPSQKFFSIRYNWYPDLTRPYIIGPYFPMENRWAGIGVGKQAEQFQKLVTTEERQRTDNATLANMRMFKAKQGSGISANEPLFPGRIIMMDDVADFEAVVGGSEVYPSSYNNSQQGVIFFQQRSGINELNLGMPQAGTPGTATGDLSRMQEGNHKADYTFDNYKIFADKCIVDVLVNQSIFGFRDRRYFSLLENGDRVATLLSLPADILRSQLAFSIELIGQGKNRVTDRSNWTQYAGMLTQYWTNIMTIAQQTGNQQLMQIASMQAVISATEAMQQIGEGFDIRNNQRLLLPKQLIASFQQMIGMGGLNGPQQLQSGAPSNTGAQTSQQGARVVGAINAAP
jgi:hypothetical protein